MCPTAEQALRLFGERDLDPAAVAVPIVRLAPCPTGTGPLTLPVPSEVEAQLAALAAVAELKAKGNACAPLARYQRKSVSHLCGFGRLKTLRACDSLPRVAKGHPCALLWLAWQPRWGP